MGSLLSRVMLHTSVAAALILLGPVSVGAQPAPGAQASSNADKQAAKKLVDAGIAAQNAKDYDKAIELYQKAFALAPHPALLFNVGQAHRLAGHPDQAVPFYERYLALDPNGSESATAREILAVFYLNLALAQLNLGQEIEARENLEHALQHGEEPLGAEQFREAQKQLREVERQLGRIRVTCQTDGAEVVLDGIALFTAPGSYHGWVKAKGHELTAKKTGYLSEARRVTVSSGELQDIELRLLTLSKATDTSRRWAAWKPWTVVASGGALTAASGVLHAISFRNFNAYDDKFLQLACAQTGCTTANIGSDLNAQLSFARRQQQVAKVGYVAGSSIIAVGVVLLYLNRARLVEQGGTSLSAGSLTVAPAVSADMFGILVSVSH